MKVVLEIWAILWRLAIGFVIWSGSGWLASRYLPEALWIPTAIVGMILGVSFFFWSLPRDSS